MRTNLNFTYQAAAPGTITQSDIYVGDDGTKSVALKIMEDITKGVYIVSSLDPLGNPVAPGTGFVTLGVDKTWVNANEIDPVFTASAAYGITSTQISNWNNAVFTASNGLTKTGNNVALGGTFANDTTISGNQKYLYLNNSSEWYLEALDAGNTKYAWIDGWIDTPGGVIQMRSGNNTNGKQTQFWLSTDFTYFRYLQASAGYQSQVKAGPGYLQSEVQGVGVAPSFNIWNDNTNYGFFMNNMETGSSKTYTIQMDSSGKLWKVSTPTIPTYGAADFIQNQNAAQQTGNFYISGYGAVDSLYAGNLVQINKTFGINPGLILANATGGSMSFGGGSSSGFIPTVKFVPDGTYQNNSFFLCETHDTGSLAAMFFDGRKSGGPLTTQDVVAFGSYATAYMTITAAGYLKLNTTPAVYSTGVYDVLVRNRTTGNVEKVSGPIPTSADYIQNQNSSKQTANFWVGSGKTTSFTTTELYIQPDSPYSNTFKLYSDYYGSVYIDGSVSVNGSWTFGNRLNVNQGYGVIMGPDTDPNGAYSMFVSGSTYQFSTPTVSSGYKWYVGGGPQMILDQTGKLTLYSLNTGGTAPATTGTTKMVIVDQNGLLSWANIPSGGTSYTLPAATTSTLGGVIVGTGLSVDGSGVLSSTATSYSFSNGLTNTSGAVTLGGTLTGNTQITNSTYQFLMTANGSNAAFTAQNTGTGAGITTSGGSGLGIQATSTSNNAGYFISSSNTAVYAGTNGTTPVFVGYRNDASTNTVVPLMELRRLSQGTPANGIGGAITFYVNHVGGSADALELCTSWTDAALATRTSNFYVNLFNNNTQATVFNLKGSGQLQLNKYGVNTFSGTAAYLIGVDASGNLIETATSGVGTSYSFANGLTNTSGTVGLGGSLTGTTTITGGAFTLNITGTGNAPLNVTTTTGAGVNCAIAANGGSGIGISANSNTSSGVSASTTSGNAISASAASGLAGLFSVNPASTNSITEVINLQRTTTGTAAAGLGGSIAYYLEIDNGSVFNSNNLVSKWTDPANTTKTSQFYITGMNAGAMNTLFTVNGNGKLQFNKYGVNTFTGTAAYYLATDSSGNIIEVGAPGSSYTLPIASATTLGGIKVGTGLAIDGTGVLSTTGSYTLPTASATVLGGVKVGTGLAIDGAGVLSNTITNNNQLTNGAGYITSSSLTWSNITSKPTFAAVATSGLYSDLTGLPTIPTNTNQLTNGSGYITLASLSAGTGISYNNTTGVISMTGSYVPTSRTITINGTAYDLSADRSWTISSGGVTGSGFPNSIAKWNSAGTALTDSICYGNNTQLGIGTGTFFSGSTITAKNMGHTYGLYMTDNSGNALLTFDSTGNLVVAANVTGYYSFSDARLKKNIRPVNQKEVAEKLMLMNPVLFQYNDREDAEDQYGFIAQDVEQIFPELVREAQRFDGKTYKTIDYEKGFALAVAAIKELTNRIEQLENK